MTAAQIAPYLGYFGSILLMVGLLVTTDLKFRIWNGLGCLVFIIYAVIIDAPPVILTNAVLLAINIFYFFKIIRRRESFDTAIVEADDVLLNKFLDFYQQQIADYFPEFKKSDLAETKNIVILRDLVVANFCALKLNDNGVATVIVNYTVQKYRDFKVGRYLFDTNSTFLKDLGVETVQYNAVHKKSHTEFLIKSGFTSLANTESGMIKKL